MPLQGNLKEMSLANLIQVNCQEMRSARLTLSRRGQSGQVYFSDGQVAHASTGPHRGENALYELLTWDDGTFTLDTDVHAPEHTIQTPWSDLLLEGMKRLAEWQATAEGTTDSAPKPSGDARMLEQLKAIAGVSGVVIAACDGVVLAADIAAGTGEKEAAVAVFAGSAAAQIGDALRWDSFSQAIVTIKNRRVLVMAQPDRYVGLWLEDNASPAIVGNAAALVLRG